MEIGEVINQCGPNEPTVLKDLNDSSLRCMRFDYRNQEFGG